MITASNAGHDKQLNDMWYHSVIWWGPSCSVTEIVHIQNGTMSVCHVDLDVECSRTFCDLYIL